MQQTSFALAIVNDLFDEDLDPDLFAAEWDAEAELAWAEADADAPAASCASTQPN